MAKRSTAQPARYRNPELGSDSDYDSEPWSGSRHHADGRSGEKKKRRKANELPMFVDQKRQTFSKRKKGMVSKAAQLSHLTGAKIFIFLANDNNHSWAYASHNFEEATGHDVLRQMRLLAGITSVAANTDIMRHPAGIPEPMPQYELQAYEQQPDEQQHEEGQPQEQKQQQLHEEDQQLDQHLRPAHLRLQALKSEADQDNSSDTAAAVLGSLGSGNRRPRKPAHVMSSYGLRPHRQPRYGRHHSDEEEQEQLGRLGDGADEEQQGENGDEGEAEDDTDEVVRRDEGEALQVLQHMRSVAAATAAAAAAAAAEPSPRVLRGQQPVPHAHVLPNTPFPFPQHLPHQHPHPHQHQHSHPHPHLHPQTHAVPSGGAPQHPAPSPGFQGHPYAAHMAAAAAAAAAAAPYRSPMPYPPYYGHYHYPPAWPTAMNPLALQQHHAALAARAKAQAQVQA